MYAVIVTGGKQYKVAPNDILKIEKLDVAEGESFDFDKVLMVGDDDKVNIGKPYVAGSKVKATVVAHGRHKKIVVLKFRRRRQYLKRQGHRQDFTQVKITGISQ